METETIDRLFLELSQVTKATTARELALEKELAAAKAELADAESRLQGYAKAVQDLTENQLLQDSATAAVMERAEKAEAELTACREDAERYKWLRNDAIKGNGTSSSPQVNMCDDRSILDGAALDAVIDAEIAARKEGA